MLADPVAAEDVTQEVFVKAWQKLPGFEGRSAFTTWLHRLAVNAVLDRRRAEKRRGISVDPADAEATADAGELTARSSSPDVAIDLERALATLPAGARTAFVLHDIEGYRHREIAELTGLAEGTWKAQLHRARKLLRRELLR
jgi:RNA polymerase sigma-70 factor (ECF subfamily)